MKELLAHAEKNKLTIAQVVMANEVAVSGKSEAEVNAFIDKISTAMVNIVKAGLKAPPGVLPGPIKLRPKPAKSTSAPWKTSTRESADGCDLGVCAGRFGRERPRASRRHCADGRLRRRHAGARLRSRRRRPRLPQEKIRDGFLAAAAVGYLGKHNATLSGAEGGCQAEIGVASAMGAALIAQAMRLTHSSSRTPPNRRCSTISG